MGVCGKEGGMSVQLKLTCYMYHSGSSYSLVWFPAWPGYEAMLNTHEKQRNWPHQVLRNLIFLFVEPCLNMKLLVLCVLADKVKLKPN